MNFIKIIWICTIFTLNVHCDNEILAINCKLQKAKVQLNENNWVDIKTNFNCPLNDNTVLSICKIGYNDKTFKNIFSIKSFGNMSCTNKTCDLINDHDYQFFKCLKINTIAKPLDVKEDCIFNHTVQKCDTESNWKILAIRACVLDSSEVEFELFKLMGIFPCISTFNEKTLTFRGIQFVCCPKLKTYEWYMKYVSYKNGTIESELLAYKSAKSSLRKKFKLRQQRIKDRYILEENAINMWSEHPKLAESVENKVKKRFRQSFMIEMDSEVDLLRELELIHENKMQLLFEKNRRDSMSRLEYTLQETNLEVSRVATALKLELDSILSEANDTINFLERFYIENLDDDKRNKELIKQNFNSLVKQSWEDVIEMVKKKNLMKDDVLIQVRKSELTRNILISRFNYLNIDYIPKNSMKSQAENFIKNVMSGFEHGKDSKDNEKVGLLCAYGNKNHVPKVSTILICLLTVVAVVVSVLVAFVFYKYSNKIMFHLSNTFKKIHPRTKNVFVQIENYQFKSRYNYGNGISQSQSKAEESFMGISSGYNFQFNSTKKSPEIVKNGDQDYSDSSISNINGLENPICRLLDEK